MSRYFVLAATLLAVASLDPAAGQPAKPDPLVPDAVRKAVAAKHSDAVLVMIYAQVKIDGTLVDGLYHFWSAAGKVQVAVKLDDRGKTEFTYTTPAAAPTGNPLTGSIPSLADGLAAAKKQGLVGGMTAPTGGSGPVHAMLTAEDNKGVWRFFGVDKAGQLANIQIAGAAGSAPPLPVTGDTESRVPPTPENIAKVLKFRVGPDADGVAVKVAKPDLSYVFTLTGRVPHPGVKMQIRRAILLWTDSGSPTFDDSGVVAPGRLGLVNSFLTGGSSQPGFLALSQDGRRLAAHKGPQQIGTARSDIIAVLDTATRQPVLTFRTPPLAPLPYSHLMRLTLSPDGGSGAAVITAEKQGAVVFFGDAAAARPVPFDSELRITGLAVAPAGKALAFACTSGLVRLVRDGKSTDLPVTAKFGPTACRWLLAFSPDGKHLAVGELDTDAVTVWDVASAKEVHKLTRAPLQVTALAWSGDGRRLAVGTTDRDAIAVFELATAKAAVLAGMPSSPVMLALFADGSRLASYHGIGGMGLWDVTAGKLVNALTWEETGNQVLAFADDGKTLLTGVQNASGEVRRWDLTGATADNPVLAGGANAIRSVTGRIDRAGDLVVTVDYRLNGMVGKDCLIVAALKNASGKPIPAPPGWPSKGADGGMLLTIAIRPTDDPENAYRVMKLPRRFIPAGAVTAEVNVSSGGKWLVDKSFSTEVKAK